VLVWVFESVCPSEERVEGLAKVQGQDQDHWGRSVERSMVMCFRARQEWRMGSLPIYLALIDDKRCSQPARC
jgi:hypothetical protein